MKLLIASFVFLLTFIAYPQADLMIHFLMYDNAIPPNNGSWELIFGLDSTATDGIDEQLGELPVPPDVCCGWGGPFLCAQFILPNEPNTTWIDYRFGELPYTGTKEHRIRYCSYPTSTIVTIQCSLPSGVTAILEDFLGGLFTHIEMVDSNEYYIYAPYIGLNYPLKLTVNYNNVVPIEFKSFTGSFLNSSVQLNWITATEKNNSGFEIQKLQDYKIEKFQDLPDGEAGWEKIGFVQGFGTTTEPKSYSFTDKDVTLGTCKYRLKQIDFDGRFSYSKEIAVVVDLTTKEFVLYQNYPNPFNPTTTIKYTIPPGASGFSLSKVTLKVYDVLGNEVATLVNDNKQPGVYEVEFDAGKFSSGVYFYQLRATPSGGRAVDPSTGLSANKVLVNQQAGSGRAFIQTRKMILSK